MHKPGKRLEVRLDAKRLESRLVVEERRGVAVRCDAEAGKF